MEQYVCILKKGKFNKFRIYVNFYKTTKRRSIDDLKYSKNLNKYIIFTNDFP